MLFAVSQTGYGSALGDNCPEIKKGLVFKNRYMPIHTFTVVSANEVTNLLSVDIQFIDIKWNEDGWNLQHTKTGFNKGEYWPAE